MSATNADIYTLVGEEIGIISGNEALSADDTSRISRRASKVRAWLIEQSACYWPDDAIPDAVALPYAMVVAGQCAEIFGRGQGSEAPYTGGPAGFQLLKEHVSQHSAKERVQAEYF